MAPPTREATLPPALERTVIETLVALPAGTARSLLADVVRALDAENVRIDHLQLHQPSLDDVFLAKTGRSLEGAGDEEEAGEATSRLAMDTA